MFIHEIKLENILSFGPSMQELELKPLNVLIGPNGSGKSNFIEAIGLLKAATTDITVPILKGGGIENWVWHGSHAATKARIEVVVRPEFHHPEEPPLHYSLAFDGDSFSSFGLEEKITGRIDRTKDISMRYLDRNGHRLLVNYRDERGERKERELSRFEFKNDQSILAQISDTEHYPELTCLGLTLSQIILNGEWAFGRTTPPRLPQKTDLSNGNPAEGGRNLGMMLNRLSRDSDAKNKFLEALRQLYDGINDFDVQIEVGSLQVILQERNTTIPATRLSDGTLRYLCLLAILCIPNPPPLICIEEPERGLHPDILPGLADLLRQTSEKTQLIVTTHSEILVDSLTDTPESIVICERNNGQTELRRLDKNQFSHWFEKYRLGDLWTSGELGGNRW